MEIYAIFINKKTLFQRRVDMARPTIKDVAALAEVSVTTVSRVINGHKNVNPQLEEKICNAIKELDYSPNVAARSIRGVSVSSIGLILPNLRDTFFGQIADDIVESARQRGQSVVISTVQPYNQLYDDYASIEFLSQVPLDGLIYFPSKEINIEVIERFLPKVPLVIGGRRNVFQGRLHVYQDYQKGGYIATQYLLRMGYRRIACLVGVWSMGPNLKRELDLYYKNDNAGAYPGIDQYIGYRRALEEAEVPYDANLVECILYEDGTINGYNAAQRLFAKSFDIDAVFAANDLSAAGVLHFLSEQRISVPERVGIVGYDDSIIAEITRPKLTSVKHDMDSIGSVCIDMLNRLMLGEECEDLKLDVELVIRQSSCNENYP